MQVPRCHQAEAPSPRGMQWFSSPWRLPGQVQRRWWYGEMSPSVWATGGIPVPWQSVQATPVEASGSWMSPQGSSRLWGQECRTRHHWCSNAAPARPWHCPSALLSLGSTKGVTAVVLLPRNNGWTNRNYWAPQHFLFLHMQDASGQPAPVQNQENPAGGCAP